jgi:hypothetical protein
MLCAVEPAAEAGEARITVMPKLARAIETRPAMNVLATRTSIFIDRDF